MAETTTRKSNQPTHQEWDWFDQHVAYGTSQYQIAEDAGTDYETVTKAVRYVSRWLRNQYKNHYGTLKTKQLYRLETVIVRLTKQFNENSDVAVAREARMAIHEWMEITGGLEPKKIEQTNQSISLHINGTIERMLESDQPVNSKMLEAAQKVKNIESRIVEVSP